MGQLASGFIRSTQLVDRAYRLFDRIRSRLVVTLASDATLEAYGMAAYGSTGQYQAGSREFREGWFSWEERAWSRFFPPPPSRVLVGGAGGGREAFTLRRAGYTVVAFDPARDLVEAMRTRAAGDPGLEVAIGRYEDLPTVEGLDGRPMTLADQAPFDAGIIGWSSLSHVRHDSARVRTLADFTRLVNGPVLLSPFPGLHSAPAPGSGLRGSIRRWLYGSGDYFAMGVGFVHPIDEAELRTLTDRAGCDILMAELSPGIESWPHAVIRRGA